MIDFGAKNFERNENLDNKEMISKEGCLFTFLGHIFSPPFMYKENPPS